VFCNSLFSGFVDEEKFILMFLCVIREIYLAVLQRFSKKNIHESRATPLRQVASTKTQRRRSSPTLGNRPCEGGASVRRLLGKGLKPFQTKNQR
jgi:hypothetical protein